MHSVRLQYTRQPTNCCKGCVFFLLFQLWHQDNLQTTQNVGRSMEAYATIFPPSHSSPSTIPSHLRRFALERELNDATNQKSSSVLLFFPGFPSSTLFALCNSLFCTDAMQKPRKTKLNLRWTKNYSIVFLLIGCY